MQKSQWGYIDEDTKKMQLPPPPADHPASPARHSTASVVSVAPSSPESPWALSPLHTAAVSPPTSPALLYHCLTSLHRLDGSISSVAVAKGTVFTGSASRRICVWRQPECLERGKLRTSSGHISAILALDGLLFTAHGDRRLRAWSFSTAHHFRYNKITTLPRRSLLISSAPRHKDRISCLAYFHAEGLLYSGSWDRSVHVWRVADRRCVDSFLAHDGHVNAMAVNQEDGCVFTASSDGSVKIWRRVYGDSSHTLTMTLRFQPSPVNALALSSTRKSTFLYSGSSDGFVNFWEKETLSGRYNHGGFLQGHRFAVLCLAAVDRLVFSGSEDATIRVWSREEGSGLHACLAVLEGHRGPVKCLAACLEMEKVVSGLLLYSASLDRTVKVWRIKVFGGDGHGVVVDDVEKKVAGNMDYELSPVLSPSWVEKKLQGMH